MKKILEIALGIVTSIGGFLEVGSVATAAQAGASFRYSLIWAIALIAILFAYRKSKLDSAVLVILLASVGFAISFFLQRRGWLCCAAIVEWQLKCSL